MIIPGLPPFPGPSALRPRAACHGAVGLFCRATIQDTQPGHRRPGFRDRWIGHIGGGWNVKVSTYNVGAPSCKIPWLTAQHFCSSYACTTPLSWQTWPTGTVAMSFPPTVALSCFHSLALGQPASPGMFLQRLLGGGLWAALANEARPSSRDVRIVVVTIAGSL